MSARDDEGFLARWSRRKRGDETAPDPALPVPLAIPSPPDGGRGKGEGGFPDTGAINAGPPAPHPLPASQDAEPLTCPIPDLPEIELASLPKLEDLTAESDFSLFLRPGIPTGLRHAALRRMWSLDPSIRDYIGPVEYQWDFNTPGGLPLGFASELVGDVRKLLAQAIGQLAEPEAASENAPVRQPDPPPQEGMEEPLPSPLAGEAQDEGELAASSPDDPAPAAVGSERPGAMRRHGGALPT